MQEQIQHFGVWIKKSDKNRINRDTYAIIEKRSSIWTPSLGRERRLRYKTDEERKKFYDDDECKIYSNSFC